MNSLVLAQIGAWSIAQWAIAIIVICGIVAVVVLVTRQMGVTIPPFFVNILWIVLAVVIGVLAVRFLADML